ncbi:MAG: Na/Pi symporter [Gammaproteobacteria bacterium]|nr:Na/Pi symporter [Gammaproteobacteria bacterium]
MNSLNIILHTCGGLGLFLLGMLVMTDGLRALGGNLMRSALMRFTHSPLSGAVTGAISTAILQSSSATTLAAIGFVSASLLSFPQALGIIFGANIGTTITGWLVATLGLKLQLESLMLPLILLGVLLRLFGKHRLSALGFTLAGFGLIFVGIGVMQQGMSGLETVITPDSFPDDSFSGRIKLVLLGIAITLVTQSSSAGVATALTALFAGAINFEQAAALVIGMDVGTTVTAVIATIGASTPSRRTGLSHVIYNLFTAAGALIILTPYILFWEKFLPGQLTDNAEIALVAFHTTFNTIGVIVILPFSQQFAQLIEKIVPERVISFTQNLDKKFLRDAPVALTAVQSAIKNEYRALLDIVNTLLTQPEQLSHSEIELLQDALDDTHHYIDQIHLDNDSDPAWKQLTACIHALDHMQRIHERCEEEQNRAITAQQTKELESIYQKIKSGLVIIIVHIEQDDWSTAAEQSDIIYSFINEQAEPLRDRIMSHIAHGKIDVPLATDQLEGIRWLRRVSRHINRICQHLNNIQAQ